MQELFCPKQPWSISFNQIQSPVSKSSSGRGAPWGCVYCKWDSETPIPVFCHARNPSPYNLHLLVHIRRFCMLKVSKGINWLGSHEHCSVQGRGLAGRSASHSCHYCSPNHGWHLRPRNFPTISKGLSDLALIYNGCWRWGREGETSPGPRILERDRILRLQRYTPTQPHL
jgi:hypothetical protein